MTLIVKTHSGDVRELADRWSSPTEVLDTVATSYAAANDVGSGPGLVWLELANGGFVAAQWLVLVEDADVSTLEGAS